MSAWPSIDHPPVIFYLDDADENFEKAAAELKLSRGTGIFTWQDLLELGEKELAAAPDAVRALEQSIGEQDVVNICYTSGTTGNPKGIMLTHLNYYTNAEDAIALFDLKDASFSTLIILPLDHSFAHTVGTYASLLRASP